MDEIIQPLHCNIPRWMITIVEHKSCEKCQRPISRKDICAVGIRNLNEKFTFYVEHQCPQCKSRVITSFGAQKTGNVEDLCYLLIEQLHMQRKLEKAHELIEKTDNIIGDKEVKDLIDFIQKAETHDEFLKYIGFKEKRNED